jgi:hypothetical protein
LDWVRSKGEIWTEDGGHAPSKASGERGATALGRKLARHKAGRMAEERIMIAEERQLWTCLTCRGKQPA